MYVRKTLYTEKKKEKLRTFLQAKNKKRSLPETRFAYVYLKLFARPQT